ncbi:hypothetical protein L916_11147, partial [Phytophthora nicotianae]
MYVLAHKLTDVRDTEEMIKLQSIEKQKLVVAVLQQSTAAIIAAHEAEFLVLRVMCARLLFNWGAQDVYKLGDVIAKNGRLCTRGEDARKKKPDWEQRVASRSNLRINAVLRCVNTVVKEGRIPRDLERTLDKTEAPMDWGDFAIHNRNHDNKLLAEFHTAGPYLKQYMTLAILSGSYWSR